MAGIASHKPKILILMGVSGCGKTTVGKMLAEETGWEFIESDDFHSKSHISKMASGIPLDDADRQPWLEALHEQLVSNQKRGQSAILACSALKENYRKTLRGKLEGIEFVFLKGSFDLIHGRMKSRSHFMKAGMLQSQFDALEEPHDALVTDIRKPPGEIVNQILEVYGIKSL